jgi:hypothetical protein
MFSKKSFISLLFLLFFGLNIHFRGGINAEYGNMEEKLNLDWNRGAPKLFE